MGDRAPAALAAIGRRWRIIVSAAAGMGLAMLASAAFASADGFGAFGSPQTVSIEGYSGSAEEPFITPDGRYLLFNSSEAEPDFSLQLASRINAQTFKYQGEIEGEGVNQSGSLSGTPSLDQEGNLYFISNRSYSETLSTVYSGRFSEGLVTGVHLVEGISGESLGKVDFDVSVSADGSTLYVSVGQYGEAGGPTSASIVMFDREGDSFVRDPDSAEILSAVNAVDPLDYAADPSTDGLELFFTVANPAMGEAPSIWRATRSSLSQPFGAPERIAAITGFAEAPSVSADGSTLYYHEQVGSEFRIMMVTRAALAPTVTKISPRVGPAAGGTPVIIKGSNLEGATAVAFGTTQASVFHGVSATEITAVAPAGTTGQVYVTVVTPGGPSAISTMAHFKFLSPTVTGVTPAIGPTSGDTTVTVHGSGFALGTSATTIRFGRMPGSSVDCTSTTVCTVLTPAASAGSVAVTARVSRKTSKQNAPADDFIYE
jgi:IPT/TIG domain/WD40-like Beta Propeller Repeat